MPSVASAYCQSELLNYAQTDEVPTQVLMHSTESKLITR